MFLHPTKPRSISAIYMDAFKFWKIGFKQYFPLVLISAIIGGLPHFFIPELNTYHIPSVVSLIENHKIFFILYFLFVSYAFTTILYRIDMIMDNHPSSIFYAMKMGAKRFPYAVAAVLISVMTLFFSYAFFIIPGIIFSILLSMYFVDVIVDGEGVLDGFERSCDLVWGHWWRTAVVLVIPNLLFWIVAYFIELATVDILVIRFHEGGEIWLLHNIIRTIFNVIYYPWFCALLLLQFSDLKLRFKQSAENAELHEDVAAANLK